MSEVHVHLSTTLYGFAYDFAHVEPWRAVCKACPSVTLAATTLRMPLPPFPMRLCHPCCRLSLTPKLDLGYHWHHSQATVQGTPVPTTTGTQPSSSTTTPEGSTTAPAPSSGSSSDSSDSGSSTNVGAIVGGVVGGVVRLALIAGGVFYWMRRRSANAAGRVDSVSNPVYDATATGELWRS